MPSFPTGNTGSITFEPTNVNYQEIEDQPALSENSMNADEAISIENEGEDVESTELVEPSNQITLEDNQPAQQDNTNCIHTRSMAGIYKPKLPYIGLTETHKEDKEPESVEEALSRPKWKEAMDAEFKALTINQTWTLVPL